MRVQPMAGGMLLARGVAVACVAAILVGLAFGSSAAASTACATPPEQNGVDISSLNGSSIDFNQVAASGITFVYARATDGTNFTDPDYASNRTKAESAGLAFGAYATFEPSQDPTAQADSFLQTAAPSGSELIPMLDLEIAPSGQSTSQYLSEITTWVNVVQSALGVRPLIYTSSFFWNTNTGTDTTFASNGYPLWVAQWAVTCPTMPSGWSNFVMWQNSDTGSVSGISGQVDTDVFNAGANGGSLSAFTVYGAQLSAPVNQTAPQITGKATVGQSLSCSHGTWSGLPSAFTYEWLKDGTIITGQTASHHQITSSDAGHRISCRVTAANQRGATSKTSAARQIPPPPAITGVSPRAGSTKGGSTVKITGHAFNPGAIVTFGAARSRSVTFVSASQLMVVVPAHRAGTVRVLVVADGGPSAASNAALYAYGAPRLTSLNPTSGPKTGGGMVTITGSGFIPGAVVKFGTSRSSTVIFVSGTRLRARAPAHIADQVAVRVVTPVGTSALTSSDRYTYH